MIALNALPEAALKDLINDLATTITIYIDDEMPKSALPAEFIEIRKNGSISSSASQLGVGQCNLMVSIYVKLLPTGATNHVREDIILGTFQTIFASAVVKSGFTFSIDKKKMVYQGKSLLSGYSTKIINVKTNI